MIAIPQEPQKMTVEEYLEWESLQDIRYEYVNRGGWQRIW